MTRVFTDLELKKKLQEIRADRYAFQSVARQALPKERVYKCLRASFGKDVDVYKHLHTQSAFYGGLTVCGSVWHCPVCATKISERRRLELKIAYSMHTEKGGQVALLTLTFSHQYTDKLIDTLKKFSLAVQDLFRGKRIDNIRSSIGLIGRIRAFEVTHGKNGWHPHVHIALFYQKKLTAFAMKRLQKELFELWQTACYKQALTTLEKYGLDLQDGKKANDYLSKHGTWSLEQELTKSHIKKGKEKSFTPFDFLRSYLLDNDDYNLFLFREYAEAFKGKRQLLWSKGLKEMFLIEEKTDEQVANEKEERADLLGSLTSPEWKQILKHDLRAKLLDLVEDHDFETAMILINDKIKKERSCHERSTQNN